MTKSRFPNTSWPNPADDYKRGRLPALGDDVLATSIIFYLLLALIVFYTSQCYYNSVWFIVIIHGGVSMKKKCISKFASVALASCLALGGISFGSMKSVEADDLTLMVLASEFNAGTAEICRRSGVKKGRTSTRNG